MGHHGERSLESFCHWQYQEFGGPRYLGTNHVPGGRDDIPPVDTAVLVTRYVASSSSAEWILMNATCIKCGLRPLAWAAVFILTINNRAVTFSSLNEITNSFEIF